MCTLTHGFQTSLHNPLIACQDRGLIPAELEVPCSVTPSQLPALPAVGWWGRLSHPGWAQVLLLQMKLFQLPPAAAPALVLSSCLTQPEAQEIPCCSVRRFTLKMRLCGARKVAPLSGGHGTAGCSRDVWGSCLAMPGSSLGSDTQIP